MGGTGKARELPSDAFIKSDLSYFWDDRYDLLIILN